MELTNYSTGHQLQPTVKPKGDQDPFDNIKAETANGPLLLTVTEACAALRVSKWMLYHLIHARRLETVKIGRRRCVPISSLRAFVDQLRDTEAA